MRTEGLVLELNGREYAWNGRRWYGLPDRVVPPELVIQQLESIAGPSESASLRGEVAGGESPSDDTGDAAAVGPAAGERPSATTSGSVVVGACPLCLAEAAHGVSLSDGRVVHTACFQQLATDVERAQTTLAEWRSHTAAVTAALQREQSAWLGLASVLDGGANVSRLEAQLVGARGGLEQAQVAVDAWERRAAAIYDFVIGYPPDWQARSERVIARDRTCRKCGSGSWLQAHHIVPLSRGGTNEAGNLQALCKDCHERAHRGRTFTSASENGPPPAFAERVKLVRQAITRGQDLEFGYKKPRESSYHKRVITPLELVEIDRDNHPDKTLCVRGYCHLRKAERNFALKRMRGLKVRGK